MRHEFDLWLRKLLRGGEQGQVLTKGSEDDMDFAWSPPSSSKIYAYFVGG